MSYPMSPSEARNDERMNDQAYQTNILSVEAMARAEAAFRDAVAKFNRDCSVWQIDAAAIDDVLHDEMPGIEFLLDTIEMEREG